MTVRMLLIVVLVIGLAGCAAPVATIDYYTVDTEALRRIKPLQEIDEHTLESGQFRKLGNVSGFHCRRVEGIGDYGDDQPEAERTALDQLKLRAAQKGASHYTAPQCVVNQGLDLVNNCWGSIKCASTAYRALDQSR